MIRNLALLITVCLASWGISAHASAGIHGWTLRETTESLQGLASNAVGPDAKLNSATEVAEELAQAQQRLDALTQWEANWKNFQSYSPTEQLRQLKSKKHEFIYFQRSSPQRPFGDRGIASHEQLKAKFYESFEKKFKVKFEQKYDQEWEAWTSDFTEQQSPEQAFEQKFLEHWNARQHEAARDFRQFDNDARLAKAMIEDLQRLRLAYLLHRKTTLKLGKERDALVALAAGFKTDVVNGARLSLLLPPSSTKATAAWLPVKKEQDSGVTFAAEMGTWMISDVNIPNAQTVSFKIALESPSIDLIDVPVNRKHARMCFQGTYADGMLKGTWEYQTAAHQAGTPWVKYDWSKALVQGEFEMKLDSAP